MPDDKVREEGVDVSDAELLMAAFDRARFEVFVKLAVGENIADAADAETIRNLQKAVADFLARQGRAR